MVLLPLDIKKEFYPDIEDNLLLPVEQKAIVKFKRLPTNGEILQFQQNFYRDGGRTVMYNDKELFESCGVVLQNLGDKEMSGTDLLNSADKRLLHVALQIRYYLVSAGSGGLSLGE